MNLHEECLLKYLLNPVDLDKSTNMLKLANELVSNNSFTADFLIKADNINHSMLSV